MIKLHINVNASSSEQASHLKPPQPSRPQVTLPEAIQPDLQSAASSMLSPSPPGTLPELAERSLDAAVASAVQVYCFWLL